MSSSEGPKEPASAASPPSASSAPQRPTHPQAQATAASSSFASASAAQPASAASSSPATHPGILSRRFPRLAAAANRFGSSRTARVSQGLWKYRRSIVFGVFALYGGVGYLQLRLDAYKRDFIHPDTYLVWKIHDGSIVESRGAPTISALLNAPAAGEEAPRIMEMFEVISALKWASTDPRIKGIFADFSGLHLPSSVTPNRLGLAQIEEIVQAVHAFKIAKKEQFGEEAKPSIAWADTFDSQGAYLLASAFDEVWLQPSGSVPLTGLGAQIPFFKKVLQNFGIKVHAEARREYKSMISTFDQEEALPPAQVQNEAELLGELNRGLMHAIGVNRFPSADPNQIADQIERWSQEGPFSSREAEKLGLITGTAYKRDLVKRLIDPKHGGNDEVDFKSLYRYHRINNRALEQSLSDDEWIDVGVVYLLGTISNAPGEFSASSVIKGLKEAAEDDDIKSIVLRIDSGGGDVVASESIWDAVKRVREDYGKPVIASFGNASASGGYYAASAADAIVACENTVTGSIGVASLRPTITRAFFDRFRVGVQSFFTGSTAGSTLHEMDEQQLARHSKHIDEMYDDFLTKVCDGRSISRDVIESLAGGRVMTGLTAWTRCNADKELEQVGDASSTASEPNPSVLPKEDGDANSETQVSVSDSASDSPSASTDTGVTAAPNCTDKVAKKAKASSLISEWKTRNVTKPDGNNTILIERHDANIGGVLTTASEVFATAGSAIASAFVPKTGSAQVDEGDDKDKTLAVAAETSVPVDAALETATSNAEGPDTLEGKAADGVESVSEKLRQQLEAEGAKLAAAAHAAAVESRSESKSAFLSASASIPDASSLPPAGDDRDKAREGGSDEAGEIKTAGVSQDEAEKLGPYGKGLIDSIGGLWDTGHLAAMLALEREKEELIVKDNLTLEQAHEALRPGAKRESHDDGSLALACQIRLKRYPEDKPFWKKVSDMNKKGDEPQLSILPRSVANTLSVLAEEVAQKAAKAAIRMLIASSMDPNGIANAFDDGRLAEQIRNANGAGWGSRAGGRAKAEYPFAAYFA